jgi:phosphatidylinositol glycan class O
MQRLKGLTTGSLPTFADISGNFGGSTIDEDSWVQQLKDTNYKSRGLTFPSRLGFVGDDTWVDLFPTQFEESYPLPSFNTRDLDTVDNGCLHKLPQLLQNLRMKDSNSKDDLEVIVSHFLGVDHVGHTYGPHNEQMDAKLRQMDAALSTTLDILDESNSCHLALIFGDHGMTEDGNHGGGSDEEINAALFVHFSPACHVDDDSMSLQSASRIMGSKYVHEIFQSVSQIDLVPTIAVLLGLPIPYQNLGGIVPSLLASKDIRHTAAALALNAAQVWRYFTIYSETANKLPNLPELQEQLNDATAAYREALQHHDDASDSNAFYKACGLFKIFLAEASELGHRVWTRFDTVGMAVGGVILLFVLLISIPLLQIETGGILMFPRSQILETALSILFIVFQSAMLSFSNSYIAAEQEIVMFMMTVLGGSIYIRLHGTVAGGNAKILPYVPLLLPVLSRLGEVIVSGHGLDPSIRLHAAHSPLLFIPSLVCLLAMRIQVYRKIEAISANKSGAIHAAMDCLSLLLLASSWLQKRSSDTTRNGYLSARLVIMALVGSLPVSIAEALVKSKMGTKAYPPQASPVTALSHVLAIVSKLLIAMMLVTGPATASSVLIVSIQGWMLHILSGATGFYEVRGMSLMPIGLASPVLKRKNRVIYLLQVFVPVQAVLWRFVVRHVFFATNHGCAFNRLHYSAAFVATIEFDFVLGGLQLFLNTFGKYHSVVIN